MFGLNVTYLCKKGMREAFFQALEEAGLPAAVRSESGCIQYEYFLSIENVDELLLMEKWESRDAQEIHLTQPHMSIMSSLKEAYVEDTHLEKYDLV